jgi:hypothetical protein
MSPDGAQKEEQLCWRGPATIYRYAMEVQQFALT